MGDPQLEAILRDAVSQKASDIHLKIGVSPYLRIHGSLSPYGDVPVSADDLDRMILAVLDGDPDARVKKRHEIDMAYTIAGVARFRCNIFRQRGSLEMVMRVVPYRIPTLDELGLPAVLKHIALEARGLVLVTGITGSGKSTTIASMIQHLNESLPVHIVTIEDPIEFVYRDVKASVSQREVGIDTETFHDALKYVLRQDPDVIVLGEMRDRETAGTAITAAETGHLVFSTLHTADAVQTIDRVVDLFPGDQMDQMRRQLASVLKACVSMRLLPRVDGKGLAAAIEVMVSTPAIHALIEENKLSEIKPLMAEGASQYGMQTFDQAILKLFKANVITKEVALEEATSPAELELAMRGITVGTVSAQSFMKAGEGDYYRQQAKERYNRARRLFQQDLYEDANREIRRALVDAPDYQEAKDLLSQIDQKLHRESQRVQVKPFVEKGLELVAQNRFEEAVGVFNQGLAQDPQNEKLLAYKRAAEEKAVVVRGVRPIMDKAQAAISAGQLAEARTALNEVLEKDPGNSEALDRYTEVLQTQARQQVAGEIEYLAKQAEAAFQEKKWFDAIVWATLVREIQPDHPAATQQVVQGGAQLRAIGVPGLAQHAGAPWTAGVVASYERGVGHLLAGGTAACLAEWRQAGQKAPPAADLLAANIQRVEELHGQHVRYHVDRGRQLLEAGDLGRGLAQIRHALQLDPQSAQARALWDSQKPVADQAVTRYLQDADQWEKIDRGRAALFCLERAYEIDPARDGLKQRIGDGRTRLQKMREIHAAMDRRT